MEDNKDDDMTMQDYRMELAGASRVEQEMNKLKMDTFTVHKHKFLA